MADYTIVTTVRLDPEYKDLFDKLSHLHNQTITDACKLGMQEILKPYIPGYHIKKEIEQHEAVITSLRDALPMAEKVDTDSLKSNSVSAIPTLDSIFLEQRESRLQDKSLISMMNRGVEPSWDRFYFKCGFQSSAEAKNWFWSEAMKRGLVK